MRHTVKITASQPRSLSRISLAEGARQLARMDPGLGEILSRLGEPPMWGRQPGFASLIKIILEQQVSLEAARTLYRRIHHQLGAMTPDTVYRQQASGLRSLGLTRQKAAYCHGLAERILDGRLDLSAIARGGDEPGKKALLQVPGLGPWSVDIYYLMALRRPDVWPRGDLALAAAMQEVKGLKALPSKDEQERIADDWAPYRSIAARLLWMHYLDARGR